jgi:hypothetical protein
MINPELTLQYVVRYVQRNPGAKHSDILGSDHDGQARRRDALALAVQRGLIVHSYKRPWTYTVKESPHA